MRDKNRLYQKKPGGVWYGWYYTPAGERASGPSYARRSLDAPAHTITGALDYPAS